MIVDTNHQRMRDSGPYIQLKVSNFDLNFFKKSSHIFFGWVVIGANRWIILLAGLLVDVMSSNRLLFTSPIAEPTDWHACAH